MADDSVASAPSNSQGQEETLAKYKRLLSMARSSLESNQAALTAKDQQISQLLAVLEEERNKRVSSRIIRDDEGGQQYPRRILCRVDVEGQIWVLFEMESTEDDWKSFSDESGLQDYLKRIPGIPLVCPTKCLSAEESAKLVGVT
ncbi:hypothetical protein EON65_09575 [archaeon]|nr:MAG: hypothetical protein EON65_09575 [archaeon]